MNYYEELCDAIANNNWDNVLDILKPKQFPRDEQGKLIEKRILTAISNRLSDAKTSLPRKVTVHFLKCLLNSCVDGFKHVETLEEGEELSSAKPDNSGNNPESYFSYNAIATWATEHLQNYVRTRYNIEEGFCNDDFEELRLCVQFLCNLATFACKSSNLPHCLNTDEFKSTIIILCSCSEVPIERGACAYVHNALKQLPENYFSMDNMRDLARPLIYADKKGIQSARDTLMLLVKKPNWLQNAYDCLPLTEEKIYLLEIMLMGFRDSVYSGEESEKNSNFPPETIEFISERFKKRSDLILKTVDSYLDGVEPTEITLLLDIICVISSKDTVDCHILQNDKSLFINCLFLLKSLHMAGKASENYFTPVQKLSAVAPSTQHAASSTNEKDIHDHPAFGFKAGLIRAIGNLCHMHKGNQELLRETDAIPLLLDCCNIDARNPLIMQWTIFALRNLCKDSPENQEIIRDCNKLGVVDSVVLHEMGLKLHESEDGKAIGIIPLPQK